MIVRDEGLTWLLITQPDHAQLAADIVGAIRTEPALQSAARDTLLLATREHDNGWTEVDAEPTIEPESGRPCDFMTGPANVKHELWLRGITRLAKTDAHAGALVAEHALTVYGYRSANPEWAPFFDSITAMRDALLQRIGMFDEASRQAFEMNYRCIRLGDSFSLQFCNGWAASQTTLGIGRRVHARHYEDDADLRAALAAAIPEVIAGAARGA